MRFDPDDGALDALITDTPPLSPPTKVDIGGSSVEVCFRVLSRALLTQIRLEERHRFCEKLNEVGLDPKLLDESGELQDELESIQDRATLRAACCKPGTDSNPRPAFSRDLIDRALKPDQQIALFERWWAWQTKNDARHWSDEQIQNLIDIIKKNPPTEWASAILSGSSGLAICVRTLADRLETSQTGKLSSGPPSTERPPSGQIPDLMAILDRLNRLESSVYGE